jgi:DNA-binding transcriptional LysR family regulator
MDVGIRIGKLPDSSMHALRVGSVRIVLCASTEYLKEHGVPEVPDDLHKHRMIASRAGNHLLDLRFKTEGRERDMQFKSRLSTNTNDSAIEAALQGYGITRLISYQLAEHLKSGKLQTVLEDWEPDPLPINILYREGRHAAANVRTFVDMMAERLRSDPALNES